MITSEEEIYNRFLEVKYDHEWKTEYKVRPPQLLETKKNNSMMCLEAALYAGYLFGKAGVENHYLGIHRVDKNGYECGHCACIYYSQGMYGAVSITFIDKLKSFTPKYAKLEDVAKHFIKSYKDSGYTPLYFGFYSDDDFSEHLGFDWKTSTQDLTEISEFIVNNYQYEIEVSE